jgi:Ca2+/Na+ antiporter
MVLLRYLYVVALVLWVGGLVVAGALVAPSVFGVLQAWNETQGRVLAGQVFGEVLMRLTWLSYAMAAVMFVTLTLHRLLGARPVKYGVRVGIMALMLLMMLATGFWLLPGVNEIQAQVGGPVSALAESDPRRIQFDRLHGLSNILYSITVLGGLALCFWESRE